MASIENIGGLQEKRRAALVAYCIGKIPKNNPKYKFLRTVEDLFELLRLDTQDSPEVQNSWVAEATSCSQQLIHAAYRKLEPGYDKVEFDKQHLDEWRLSNNYPDWAATQIIKAYPENYIDSSVRMGKTSLFTTLETNINQTRLTTESVHAALQVYLESFAKICNLDVVSAWMEGNSPDLARYYFIARTRSDPRKYFWRMADIGLDPKDLVVNPAVWTQWLEMDVPVDGQVLDVRLVFWNGQLCVVWAVWRPRVESQKADEFLPDKLEIFLAFKRQNDQWSPPTSLLTEEYPEKTSPDGTRLIATVWADYENPKGKLGVMLTNGGALKAFDVRDVFMRPLPHDDGSWLEDVAQYRFKTGNVIQHSLLNQPNVVPSDAPAGNLTPYLGLHATAFRVGANDVLVVRGYCWATGLTGPDVSLTLQLKDAVSPPDPLPLPGSYALAGGWNTDALVFTRPAGSWTDPAVFTFGNATGAGSKQFALTIKNVTSFDPATLLKNSRDAAQFLSLNQPDFDLEYVRLNTLFTPELVRRASVSVEAVLAWSAQFLVEPAPDGKSILEPGGAFYSANGRYFWELFFHLSHLVATRLRAEDRFQEAEEWLHNLFDPQAPATAASPGEPARPRYWCFRLFDTGGNPGSEALNPLDGDAIAYAKPEHYKILVFCEYVRNQIAWGDWHYRQLTRDSLTAARLCYIQAKFLMGKAPSVNTVNRWQAIKLDDLLTASRSRSALVAFEKKLSLNPGDFPRSTDASASSGLIGTETFTAPVNDTLLRLFALPVERLYNLQHNLTLDGNPRDIAFFSPPADPKQLMRDQLNGGAGTPRAMGGRVSVIAFRWRIPFDLALRAVQTLQDYGNQVLNLLDRRDQAELAQRQQAHLVELGDYARTLQEQTIDQVRMQVTALELSREVAQQRADAYARLYTQNVSTAEYQVMDKIQSSKELALLSSSIKLVGAGMDLVPNVYGLANGGSRWGAIPEAVAFGLSIAADAARMEADKVTATEAYRRRQDDWGIQRDQADREVKALDAQIEAQKRAVSAAQTNLEQTLHANRQALTIHNFLQKRATNDELFNWMLGQLKALNYQAYDAVVSLCLQARNSMNAETGDYDSHTPLPMVWLDNRHGLTAGEHLRLWLLRLEQAYLSQQERRLELVKTISLRQLFDNTLERQPGIHSWTEAWDQLKRTGRLEISLTQLLFDRDYPGHYCRQVSSVELDFPMVKGPYQDVMATFHQISSKIATKPTAASVKHLHNPEDSVAPSDVQINLRSGQSITVSTGIADNGKAVQRSDEGWLDPFEYTGAISRWQLTFPWPGKEPQKSMLESLTDIILRIRYTAKAGDATFTRQVEDLVKKAETPGTNKKSKGARGHA